MILEDEPLAQQLITGFIGRIPGLQLTATARHPAQAFELLHRQPVDLLFLDIQLPVLTGLQFIKSMTQPPAVIIITAYPEHALESYEVAAIDYLLKPVSFERFEASVLRYLKQVSAKAPVPDYTFFKVNGHFVKVLHADILYIQSIRDYMLLYTTAGNHIIHMTMKHLESLLPDPPFKRIHRSFMINETKVTSYNRQKVCIGSVELPMGKNYKSLQGY